MILTGRVLALDLGKKRIGLAISDELGISAQGLPTLARINKRTDLGALCRLIRERSVTQILMGNPLEKRLMPLMFQPCVRRLGRPLKARSNGTAQV